MMIKIPRLTQSIFLDQLIYMQLAGVLIGLAFPPFLVWYGFPKHEVFNWQFFVVTQIAGQLVGLISFLLISTVVRPHLKLLSKKMQEMTSGLEGKHFVDYKEKCQVDVCHLDVVSNDEIGISASSYNQLLTALIEAHETEKVFNQFTQVMTENLEVEALSEKTVELLIKSTNFSAAAILISKSGELDVVANKGILEPEKLGKRAVLKDALEKGEFVHIRLPEHIQLDGVLTQFTPSEVLVAPIEFKSVHLGLIVAASGSLSSQEHCRMILDIFSRSVGLALNNALTHSKFQRLAAYDSLTNVYNRRFGMARLKEEFSKAERESSPISVIMVDIDHFKRVNDTYGHLTGDRAIILIAGILKNILREGDTVVRYGGEEFFMILNGANCDNANRIAHRIRNQVKDTVFKEGEQLIPLTVSLGLICYPQVTVNSEIELLDKADQALYHAKQNGRNRVIEFGKTGEENINF